MSIFIVLIVLTISIIGIWHRSNGTKENKIMQEKYVQEQQEETKEIEKNENKEEQDKEKVKENWMLEIPEISLIAEISEGTDEETLNKYVGHFIDTPKENGNVGLAAHNRGYPVNYFANLKKLKGGEEIIYTYGGLSRTYVVTLNIKIKDTDWSYLENSNENKLTLITCIENEPEYRRCIQAIEKEEKQLEESA